MKLISVKLNEEQHQGLTKLIKKGLYPSKSEAIRVAIRDLILREKGKY